MPYEITNRLIAEKAHSWTPAIEAIYEDEDTLYFEHGEQLLKYHTEGQEAHVRTNLLAYCNQGAVRLRINDNTVHVRQCTGVICPSNTVLTDLDVQPGTELHLLCISNQLLPSMLHDKIDVWYKAVYLGHINTLDLTSELSQQATAFYKDLLHFRVEHQEYNYSRTVIKLLMQTIVTDICSMLSTSSPTPTAPHPAAERMFGEFVALISSTAVKHQPVDHYAQQLCVSAKHLSKVSKQLTGKTAAQWITQAVKEDICRALADPTLSNKEIADRLGFGGASFFGRYVREQFGCTPATLRKKLNAEAHFS